MKTFNLPSEDHKTFVQKILREITFTYSLASFCRLFDLLTSYFSSENAINFARKKRGFCKHWARLETHFLAKIRILMTLERYPQKRYKLLSFVLFYSKAL